MKKRLLYSRTVDKKMMMNKAQENEQICRSITGPRLFVKIVNANRVRLNVEGDQ